VSEETFAAALRAELDAVVARYEALVRAVASVASRETEALRGEAARLAAESQRAHGEVEDKRAEVDALRRRVAALEEELASARADKQRLELDARAAMDATQAYEEELTAERRFAEAAAEVSGSLLGEALAAAVGRPIDTRSATLTALKGRGVEAALVAALKERGKNVIAAPLLPRERAGLASLAKAAGAELLVPPDGARFSASSMDKASTVSDPAEEGNVIGCAMPGLRRAGTDGALLFPRVIVATG
jgi:chromosome segregation ATPase